jgi:pSer/pThr/pTyr-binding forkhead associated (FHA) protein
LESTNGTKVNGEDIQLRILRHGDMISLGRSVLLFGSRSEIAERMSKFRSQNSRRVDDDGTILPEDDEPMRAMSQNFDLAWAGDEDQLQAAFHALEPPELPDRLSPSQAAQLAELLDYLHIRLRQLLASAESERRGQRITLEFRQWQDLLDLQARLAEYLRKVGDPSRE